jgi:protein TonB
VKRATIIVSAVIHAGVAMSLMGAAQRGEKRKAISVAVTDAKKKDKPKPPPPPAPPPRRAPRVVASVPKAAPVEAPPPKAAPVHAVETALAMSNDDAPGGIALAPAGAAAAAAAPARVASAVSSARTRRAREALGAGPNIGENGGGGSFDDPCNEEPTKPVPVAKVDLEYTVAAKTEGIEGKIKLKLIVAADGSVSDVEVLQSVEAALDAVAVAAARQWRFRPAMACGKPVAGGTYIMTKTYELTD